jgi:putative endonuclease
MFTVYILKSIKFKKRYIGHTDNFLRRFIEHNSGKSKSTKPYSPYKLIFRKNFGTRSEAMSYEKFLKGSKGGNKFYEEISKR